MDPRQGDIWFLEYPRLRKADHGHYVLVTQITRSGNLTFNYIATDSTSFQDFPMSDRFTEFRHTGLSHTSHLLREDVQRMEITEFKKQAKYRGQITGELKARIEDWWGEPI